MYGKFKEFLTKELADIQAAGLYKNERVITTPQKADIKVNAGEDVLNFCANNYLGLSDNKRLIEAAKAAMDTHGYGMSSVRFICGTQDLHKQLEAAISDYFHTEDTILYAACFDANGGLFEPLLTDEDAIISDALNHASIIDGVRLCKAKRYRYANADMADLERCLQEAQAQRFRIIATDGVFSMDGNVAPMDKICELAEKYDALVMVDESHSAGVVGPTGHGVAEQFGVYGRVDIFTGTLGKAFGGAMGGFTTGRKEIIDMLRQRSRPYLFSNSVAPAIVGASLEMFRMLKESNALDFDDLIYKTVLLFRTHPEVLDKYQERFRYIMVDEYQDTNTSQYELVHMLAAKYQNLCVVGDDDQSIYGWRGANIRNILDFEKDFPNTTVIKLEQNYRSTKKILDAANAVIHNNVTRKEKSLWTENDSGSIIHIYKADNEYDEARYVAEQIEQLHKEGKSLNNFAVLYRANAQSRTVEDQLVKRGIPYRLFGGVRFYERKEIRDILSYLKVLANPADTIALRRIINVPKRGIGDTSLEKVVTYAQNHGMGLYEALAHLDDMPELKTRVKKFKEFYELFDA